MIDFVSIKKTALIAVFLCKFLIPSITNVIDNIMGSAGHIPHEGGRELSGCGLTPPPQAMEIGITPAEISS